MVRAETKPVDFFEHLDELESQLARKSVFIFLDYDGTLTPIVDTPDLAILSSEMRAVVRELSSYYKVSVVSGRATNDVRGKVNIDGIFYAGSHGFEIVDPDGKIKINDEAQAVTETIGAVHQELSEKLKHIRGALVENVKYTISAHYRLVSDKDFPEFEKIVEEVLKSHPQLRRTSGKKVFELRPRIDWHKGKAVEWIMNVLGYHADEHLALYIGDDVTDEDAFAAMKGRGFGILVAEEPRESRAAYWIKNTDEVKKVLQYFIELKRQ